MQATKIQTVEVSLEKCVKGCGSGVFGCYPKDRHYPYSGTLDLIPARNFRDIDIIRLNLMLSPENRIDKLSNLPVVQTPKGYKLYTSVHDGAKD